MQRAEQQRAQQERQRVYGRPFPKGVSGNPAGSAGRRERLERKVAAIAEEFGGLEALSATEAELVRQAAEMSANGIGSVISVPDPQYPRLRPNNVPQQTGDQRL
jgi:hypothetical protein